MFIMQKETPQKIWNSQKQKNGNFYKIICGFFKSKDFVKCKFLFFDSLPDIMKRDLYARKWFVLSQSQMKVSRTWTNKKRVQTM